LPDATAAGCALAGELTTPQLHYAVYCAARGAPVATTHAAAVAAHIERLAAGFAALVASAPAGGDAAAAAAAAAARPTLVLDCANGVGAAAAAALAAHPSARAAGLSLSLRNARRAGLNHRCGADFVQKARAPPDGIMASSQKDNGDDAPAAVGNKSDAAAAAPPRYAASLDGDADRVVFFECDAGDAGAGAPRLRRLLDGDKTAALVALHVASLAAAAALPLRLAVVQTAYANGASGAFLRARIGGSGADAGAHGASAAAGGVTLSVLRTPTGVKHLHAAAERFDVGIYWESNGHGAALFSDDALTRIAAAATSSESQPSSSAAARGLAALAAACNPAVGDALSGVLLVEGVLRARGWGLPEWDALYEDLPSKQIAVKVADRSVLRTPPGDETRAVAPQGLQAAVDAAVAGAGAGARAFARASGTEDVVRVYAEAATRDAADALALEVARAVHALAGGVGPAPGSA
jgi:phosphoacetylglucosamine mutase